MAVYFNLNFIAEKRSRSLETKMKSVLLGAFFLIFILILGCSTTGGKMNTVEKVDVKKFMGEWYVIAGRFTFLEVDVHNGLEIYNWNEKEQLIEVDFTYNKGSFDGPKKSVPQKAWVYNTDTNAHWKVSPFWPLKFDYLIIDLDKNYQWTAIGVPSQKYLWIMSRNWRNPEPIIKEVVNHLNMKGYDTRDLVRVPHKWSLK